MSIELLQAHYGFTRMPFGRDLAPQMLHRSTGHSEESPESDGVSKNEHSALLPAKLAPGKPWQQEPQQPRSTTAETPSSTLGTQP